MIGDPLPRTDADTVVIAGDLWNELMDRVERLEHRDSAPPLMMADNGTGQSHTLIIPLQIVRFKVSDTTDDSDVMLAMRLTDAAGKDVSDADDPNAPEIPIRVVSSPGIGDDIFAYQPAGGTDKTYDDGGDSGAQAVTWREVAGGFDLKYGTLTTLWNPGDATCNLQPCAGPDDDTALTDSDDNPLDPLDVYIRWPLSKIPNCLAVDVGDILPYFDAGADKPVLFDPPQLPDFVNKWEVIQNVGVDSLHPQAVADQLRAGT